jgi:hypothetical protein
LEDVDPAVSEVGKGFPKPYDISVGIRACVDDLLVPFADVVFVPCVRVRTDQLLVETYAQVIQQGESKTVSFISG